jgi:hypothetical protein
MTDGWADLDGELAAWRMAGRRPTLWWRDDDAVAATAALDRLLALAARWRVPLALAVVPGRLEPSLAARLSQADPDVAVLPHGWVHASHAPADAKKAELGADRPVTAVQGDIAAGWTALAGAIGARARPVLVPPWNRIAPAVIPELPKLGLRGLSTFGARPAATSTPAMTQVNTHVDPVAWRAGRGFRGADATLAALVGHLRARRLGSVDAHEPTGLLTHHLVHDAAGWAFLEALLAVTAGRADWRGVDAAFGLA